MLPLDSERDIVRIQEWLVDMKLSAELFLEQPSGLPVQLSSDEILVILLIKEKNHVRKYC